MSEPLHDALEAIGLRFGEPIRVADRVLVFASCLRCQVTILSWVGSRDSTGNPLAFDFDYATEDQDACLWLHGSHFDPDEIDEDESV